MKVWVAGEGPNEIGSLARGSESTETYVGVETLEHWLLAIGGQQKSESLSKLRVEAALQKNAVRLKKTDDYVSWCERKSLDGIPNDARSLTRWLQRVRVLLDKPAG